MQTVKLVQHDGHEQIHSAERVWADRAPEFGVDAMKVHATPPGGGAPLTFQGYGTVYVMNAAGATIAKYWLGYGEDKSTTDAKPIAA